MNQSRFANIYWNKVLKHQKKIDEDLYNDRGILSICFKENRKDNKKI